MISKTVPDGLTVALAELKGPPLVAALYVGAELNVWLDRQVASRNAEIIKAEDLPSGVSSEVELWLAGGLNLLCKPPDEIRKIGRASCRERVCQYVEISGGAVALKKNKCIDTRGYA